MKVKILGCGTSEGVPLLLHSNEGLDLNDRKNWRTRSSIHVEMGDLHVQVDAGPEFRLQCLENKVTKIDLVLLTHGHADHMVGMDDLRRFCTVLGKPLPVYGNEATLQRVREVFPYAIGKEPEAPGYPCFELRVMPKTLEFEEGIIESVILPHGPCNVLGYVFTEKSTHKRIVYYCDCNEIKGEAFELAKKADIVILDGLRPHPHISHMTLQQATETALALESKQAYLTHMSFFVDYKKYSEGLPSSVQLAYDGLECCV